MGQQQSVLGTVIRLEGEQQTAWQALRVGGGVEAALAHDMQGDITAEDPGGCGVVNLFAEDEPHRFQNVTIRARVGNPLDKTCSDRATDDGEFVEIGTLKEPGRTFALVVVNRF